MMSFEVVSTAAKVRFLHTHRDFLEAWHSKLLDSVDAQPLAYYGPDSPGEPLGIPGLPESYWTSKSIVECILLGANGGHLNASGTRDIIVQAVADFTTPPPPPDEANEGFPSSSPG